MTAISGLICSSALKTSNPLGLLAKMLLESQQWHSQVMMLRWEAKPIYSERVTTTMRSERDMSLGKSATILSISDTMSSRSLFRLVPWAHHIEETESSSLPTELLKTPTAMDGEVKSPKKVMVKGNSGTLSQEVESGFVEKRWPGLLQTPVTTEFPPEDPKKMRERAEKKGYKNGTQFKSLQSQLVYDPKWQGLLPTPIAGEWKDSAITPICATKGERDNLPRIVARSVYGLERGHKSPMSSSFSAMASSRMLPTPTTRDWKGRTNPGVVKEGSGCLYGELLPDVIHRIGQESQKDSSLITDGETFRLSPLFTEEMMGFPLMWTTLPFLSHNGKKKV